MNWVRIWEASRGADEPREPVETRAYTNSKLEQYEGAERKSAHNLQRPVQQCKSEDNFEEIENEKFK